MGAGSPLSNSNPKSVQLADKEVGMLYVDPFAGAPQVRILSSITSPRCRILRQPTESPWVSPCCLLPSPAYPAYQIQKRCLDTYGLLAIRTRPYDCGPGDGNTSCKDHRSGVSVNKIPQVFQLCYRFFFFISLLLISSIPLAFT